MATNCTPTFQEYVIQVLRLPDASQNSQIKLLKQLQRTLQSRRPGRHFTNKERMCPFPPSIALLFVADS